MSEIPIVRILDAAANRAGEGLRVVEDYVRFVLDDAHMTEFVKALRHDLAELCSALPHAERTAARDTQRDVGTEISTESETARADAWDVCLASLERTKQSLRSLEEYSKVACPESAGEFEALRYGLYTFEKAVGTTQDSLSRLEEVTLCVLVDGCDSKETYVELLDQLMQAGVGMIQLRDKKLSDRELAQRALMLVTLARCSDTTPPCVAIINDRPDIAAVVDADGVHLGQDDLSVKDARSIVGPRKLIGISTHSIEQARAAVLDGANYLGAGPTFPSRTKEFETFPGLDFLQEVAAEITLPTFAIGGINAENLPQVLDTGITRVAVSGAITEAKDTGETAARLLNVLRDTTAR